MMAGITSFSQSRGVLLMSDDKALSGKIYAVIIGISNYQNVEKLKFADKDALAFADYLKSVAGGSVDTSNIKLLLNENATTGKIDAAFGWLADHVNSGDIAIIYFAGHGDVETRTNRQNGYLLSYDSPKNVYIAGALPVSYLSDFVSTLTDKKAQVLLITDACRSGKLAGGMEGAKQTSSMLMNQWSSEIKILSCQAGELSQEGVQWGGGRGVFSYYLIEGLSGLADVNNDKQVTLSEIYAYLIKNIPEETKPMDQNPMVFGKMQTVISKVDSLTLAGLILQNKNKSDNLLSSLDLRGKEKGGGNKSDESEIQKKVEEKDFKEDFIASGPSRNLNTFALLDDNVASNFPASISGKTKLPKHPKNKQRHNEFLNKNGGSGNKSFDAYEEKPETGDSSHDVKRKMIADLRENAQKTINEYLEGKITMLTLEECNTNAASLQKVADLLGDKYFLINSIKAKQKFFEALSLKYYTFFKFDTAQNHKVISKLQECIALEPEAAYAYNELGCFYFKTKEYDKAISALNKAIETAPQWIFPYTNMGVAYYYQNKLDEAISYYEKALTVDSTNVQAWNNLGYFYSKKKQPHKAIDCFNKSVRINPQFGVAYFNLWKIYAKRFNPFKASKYLKKGMQLLHKQKLRYSDIDGLLVFSRVVFKRNSTIMK